MSLSTGALGGGSGPTRTVSTLGVLSPSSSSTAVTATEYRPSASVALAAWKNPLPSTPVVRLSPPPSRPSITISTRATVPSSSSA